MLNNKQLNHADRWNDLKKTVENQSFLCSLFIAAVAHSINQRKSYAIILMLS